MEGCYIWMKELQYLIMTMVIPNSEPWWSSEREMCLMFGESRWNRIQQNLDPIFSIVGVKEIDYEEG